MSKIELLLLRKIIFERVLPEVEEACGDGDTTGIGLVASEIRKGGKRHKKET